MTGEASQPVQSAPPLVADPAAAPGAGQATLARFRRGRWLKVFLVVAVLAVGGYFGGRQLWAVYHFNQAEKALQRQDYKEARAHLSRCLEVWPRGRRTHLLLARTARLSQDYVETQCQLDACRELGDDPEVALEQDLYRAQLGDLLPVERSLVSRLDLGDESAPLILEALVQGYIASHRLSDAMHRVDQLLERNPNHIEARRWRGWALEHLNRFREALENYAEAVRLDPEREWARFSYGELLLFYNRATEAVDQFEFLRQRLPDNPAVLLGVARARRLLGEFEEAQRLLDKVLATGFTDPLLLRERGQVALDAGRAGEAETWLRRALKSKPNDRQALFALATALSRTRRADAAKEYFDKVAALDALRIRLEELNETISRRPFDPALRYEAGTVCLGLGEDELAVYWFRQTLVIDPAYPRAHQALADFYEHHGQQALAAEHRRAAGGL